MPYWIKVSTQQRVVRVASMLTGKSCILPALIYFIVLTSFAQDLTIKKIVAAASDHQPVKFASVAIRNTIAVHIPICPENFPSRAATLIR